MARWRNYFSQILNVHGVSDVRQAEIHTTEPLVPEPSALEVKLVIEKLKSHKLPASDQIRAEPPAWGLSEGLTTPHCEKDSWL
jgi:hypothetical protein